MANDDYENYGPFTYRQGMDALRDPPAPSLLPASWCPCPHGIPEAGPCRTQFVAKIPRTELEDRYLRVVTDNIGVKRRREEIMRLIRQKGALWLRLESRRKGFKSLPTDVLVTELVQMQTHRLCVLEDENLTLQERKKVLRHQQAAHGRLAFLSSGAAGRRFYSEYDEEENEDDLQELKEKAQKLREKLKEKKAEEARLRKKMIAECDQERRQAQQLREKVERRRRNVLNDIFTIQRRRDQLARDTESRPVYIGYPGPV